MKDFNVYRWSIEEVETQLRERIGELNSAISMKNSDIATLTAVRNELEVLLASIVLHTRLLVDDEV
jgi:hypothetical protein